MRLIQHTSVSGTSEALYKDLLLAVQLEVCAIMPCIKLTLYCGFYM